MKTFQRIEFIDLAKGICIILVVSGHVIESINLSCPILFCLRMPLYFCLSGLFFKPYNNFIDFLRRKTNKLLIPFIFFYLFSYLIYAGGNIAIGRKLDEARFHLLDLFYSNSFFNTPIWFLLCLFEINLLFYFLIKVTKQKYVAIGVILSAIIGFTCAKFEINNPLFLLTSLSCIPFFYLGYLLKRTNILLPSIHRNIELCITALLWVIGIIIVLTCETPPRIQYYRNTIVCGNFLQIYLSSFCLVCGLLLTCKQIVKIPILSYFGHYSIIILCTHLLVSPVSGAILLKISNMGYLSEQYISIVNLFIVIFSMFIIIPFSRKYLAYFVAQKDLITEEFINNHLTKRLK